MDYFFQEQRWTDTFLSLHVKKFKRIILFLLIAFSATGTKAQSDVEFNDYVRYSQWVIDSRLGDFYGNTNDFGFTTYNRDLSVKKEVTKWKSGKENPYIDYVAGLVAKATIEAAEYYKNFDWSKPWFKSVEWYGNKCTVPTSPDNLDAINASKMYFGIYALANGSFSSNAESTTASKATTQLGNALSALKHYNETYAFTTGTTLNSKDIAGGWYHKRIYEKQMWLDGQYMGPALLAQLINGYSSYKNNKVSEDDWSLITKQFTIVWDQCWDSENELLYHAFSSEQLNYWTSDAEIWTTAQKTLTKWTKMTAAGHSAAFWGRAEGWYFLALVDVLEQMQIAGLTQSTNYATLKGYLDKLALGIAKRQDEKSGCWYQLIGKDGNYSARYYNGKDKGEIKNYLESSCTAIFAAAFLKATRLQLLSSATDGTKTYNYKVIGTNAYKGVVTQFMKQRTDGTVDLFGCCKSAGLGTTGLGDPKFRDGSNAYYLHGHDVAPTSTTSNNYTEGKVLGAFIMAATEYERLYQPSTLLSKDLNSTYTLSSNESLSVEVLGDGTAKYQWYNANTSTAIEGATNASYIPTESGKYYCVITVTPSSTSAKTRATSGSYTITTRTADVTVEGTATTYTVTFNAGSNGTCSTPSLTQESARASITLPNVTANTGYTFDGWYTAATGGTKRGDAGETYTPTSDITLYAQYKSTVSTSVVATFENPTKTTWNEKDKNGFTITGVSGIKEDKSAKLSSGGSITLKIPEGYTVTGFDFTLLCTNTTVGSTLSVGNDEIFVKDGTHTLHHKNLSSSVTGPTTLTITNSGRKELNIESIKVYGSNGKSISFTTHPQDAEYVTSTTAKAKALTVEAQVNNFTGDAPTINYQWYRNGTKSTDNGILIENEKNASYTPVISTAGTTYYYCMATATVDGKTLEAYSNIATVTVSDPVINISTQPESATYGLNQTTGVEPLMVVATTNSGNGITYQWYSKDTESAESGTKIENATSAEYLPLVDQVGTKYYYCEVKSGSLTKNTETVTITVTNDQPIYKYQVSKAGLAAPGINTSKYITTTSDETGETGEKLVKMTFGGWKWNGGEYKKPGSETETIKDSWKDSETVSGVTVLDGYQYWFSGTQDAKQEDKDAETEMYGKNRYGWFVSPTRENGITTDSHPYTLPVRGSFMTFEPTKNGTLTIYILQNGVWNSDTEHNIDIIPGEFRMHAFQITNQRGLVLAEFAPTYSVTNNQMVNPDYTCSQYLTKPETFNDQSKDVSNWKEFWDLSEAERKAVHDSWSDPENNGCQKIIKLDNGSFLAIQKAVVKYQFHVTGNETYYFFSNFSKMGFSGATFQPDAAQPTDVTTFSGVNSLSDTKDYTEMTMEKNGTIEGTDLTNYKYTIDGKEVGKVDGVFIPQFRAITLKRTFKPNQWTTLSLPFNLTQTEVEQIFGTGTQIIVFDKANYTPAKLYLTFFYHEIQNVLPGYPYLIRPTLVDAKGNKMVSKSESADNTPTYTITGDGDNITLTEFTVYNKAINPHIKPHEFKSGDYTAKCTPSYCNPDKNKNNYSMQYEKGDIFVSEGDGTVYISEGSSYGKGYRSYIDYTGTTAPAKALSISFSGVEDDDDNGTTTEIRVTELADDVIETLGIGGVYNLNGQKVADTTRNLPAGIYIVNGRKVVVK